MSLILWRLLFKEKEDPRITGRRGRSKSKDVAASMEARLERMERAVADIGMQLEDEIPSSATLEAAVEDLRGEALGALNSMADTLRQEFQRQLDQVFAELASFLELDSLSHRVVEGKYGIDGRGCTVEDKGAYRQSLWRIIGKRWGCPPSKFPWTYSSKETCYLLEGKVKVFPDGSKEGVEIGAGDLVVFPKGMSCTWDVSEAVDKHYNFE
ncbi:hypothetical protein F0562_022543 [Nyssa sinensis]|uniref:(S)-ureidoglycine aminohydrolase cupin domain-containing protein n=1 Tax=Nyssa sinensis TaxID=561372 RepID=A0A5J5BTF5_9ASTE|nr:hypothetical protein F0562_022543 [Nyssa sinensis]